MFDPSFISTYFGLGSTGLYSVMIYWKSPEKLTGMSSCDSISHHDFPYINNSLERIGVTKICMVAAYISGKKSIAYNRSATYACSLGLAMQNSVCICIIVIVQSTIHIDRWVLKFDTFFDNCANDRARTRKVTRRCNWLITLRLLTARLLLAGKCIHRNLQTSASLQSIIICLRICTYCNDRIRSCGRRAIAQKNSFNNGNNPNWTDSIAQSSDSNYRTMIHSEYNTFIYYEHRLCSSYNV